MNDRDNDRCTHPQNGVKKIGGPHLHNGPATTRKVCTHFHRRWDRHRYVDAYNIWYLVLVIAGLHLLLLVT